MRTRQLAVLTTGVAAVALAAVALATPGANVTSQIFARAGFLGPVDIMISLTEDHKPGTQVLHVRDAKDTLIQQIVFGPGGHTGWHSHPGPVVVLVAEGELTLFSADDPTCTGRTYRAGEAFIDPGQGHVHLGRARSEGNTVLWVAYFDVPPGPGAFRVDASNPGNCGF